MATLPHFHRPSHASISVRVRFLAWRFLSVLYSLSYPLTPSEPMNTANPASMVETLQGSEAIRGYLSRCGSFTLVGNPVIPSGSYMVLVPGVELQVAPEDVPEMAAWINGHRQNPPAPLLLIAPYIRSLDTMDFAAA